MKKRTFLKTGFLGLLGWWPFMKKPLSPLEDHVPANDELSHSTPMKIAFIVFNELTLLDLVGLYDPIARLRSMEYLPELQWDFCAFEPEVKDNHGFSVPVEKVRNNLGAYDAVIVPGGFGTRSRQHDEPFVEWLQTATEVPYKISVCTGALLLGAAGFLEGRRATTNASEYKSLEKYCGEVIRQKVVEDGNVITAGGVSSSLDLGLFLCEKWAGKEAREEIQQRMDYRCYSG